MLDLDSRSAKLQKTLVSQVLSCEDEQWLRELLDVAEDARSIASEHGEPWQELTVSLAVRWEVWSSGEEDGIYRAEGEGDARRVANNWRLSNPSDAIQVKRVRVYELTEKCPERPAEPRGIKP